MKLDWDDRKNAANIEKHGLSFAEVGLVFEGPHLSQKDTRFDYGETRWVTIGLIGNEIVIVVVHMTRDETRRIISARHANRSERRRYHDHCACQ
jgi:uncharacterized protein